MMVIMNYMYYSYQVTVVTSGFTLDAVGVLATTNSLKLLLLTPRSEPSTAMDPATRQEFTVAEVTTLPISRPGRQVEDGLHTTSI